MFMLQFPTFSFTPRLRMTASTPLLANWLASSTASFRRSSKDLRCILWSSGIIMCKRIIPCCPQLPKKSFFATRMLVAQRWELIFEKRVPSESSAVPAGSYKLRDFHSNCSIQYRAREKLLLPCNCHWWR